MNQELSFQEYSELRNLLLPSVLRLKSIYDFQGIDIDPEAIVNDVIVSFLAQPLAVRQTYRASHLIQKAKWRTADGRRRIRSQVHKCYAARFFLDAFLSSHSAREDSLDEVKLLIAWTNPGVGRLAFELMVKLLTERHLSFETLCSQYPDAALELHRYRSTIYRVAKLGMLFDERKALMFLLKERSDFSLTALHFSAIATPEMPFKKHVTGLAETAIAKPREFAREVENIRLAARKISKRSSYDWDNIENSFAQFRQELRTKAVDFDPCDN
jgi:hypothetical protein